MKTAITYTNFQNEREARNHYVTNRLVGNQLFGVDDGIVGLVVGFNQLPFAFTNGWSCSGLFREHRKGLMRTKNQKSKYISSEEELEEHFRLKPSFDMVLKDNPCPLPLWLRFAIDIKHPDSAEFLEDLRQVNANTLLKELDIDHSRQGYVRGYEGGQDFEYQVFTDVPRYNKIEGSILSLKGLKSFWKATRGITSNITQRKFDALRDEEIRKVHQTVLRYLPKKP